MNNIKAKLTSQGMKKFMRL